MKFNYKRSLLSVAALAALSVTAVNADYIPLTDSAGHDQKWTLFGVTGLKASGAGAGTTAGTFSIAIGDPNTVTDDVLDDLYVAGLKVSTGQSLAKVKVLSPYAKVEVRVDTTNAVFNDTEPTRTMYVKMSDAGGAAFALTYRASLEGRTMQYSTTPDGSDAHTIIISSDYTYNNPGLGEVIQEVAGLEGSTLSKLSDMVDYDFTNNPSNYAYYDKDTEQNVAGTGEYLRVYSYDAATEVWKLYDSRNTDTANDFDSLEKGKAYWAKMHNGATTGGLVLGSSSISAAEYASAGVVAGWNLLAFDRENPFIRKSETGLILTLKSAGQADGIKIWDASGNHFVTADINGTNIGSINLSAKDINNKIKQAKIAGKLPDVFNLKAFALSATEIVLISTERFMIDELTSDTIGAVTTLTGANPYTLDPTDLIKTSDTDPIDLDFGDVKKAAMSKYGEYAMIIEPLVGDADNAAPWDTAASIDDAAAANITSAKIHIQSAASDATTVDALAIDGDAAESTALTNTITTIDGADIGGYTVHAHTIDLDYNGTTDSILLSSDEPFYVRDYTFSRVFKYTDNNTSDGNISIAGTGKNFSYSPPADENVSVVATKFTIDNSKTVATEDADGNIILISSAKDANEFTVKENTSSTVDVDLLKDATVKADIGKGAIKGVYSLGAFAANETKQIITFTLDTPDDNNDSTLTTIKNTRGAETADSATVTVDSNDVNNSTTWAVDYQKQLETLLATAGIKAKATAIRNSDDDINVTIDGVDIQDIKIDYIGGEASIAYDSATVDAGILVTISPDLASDLRFNAVYTPNYVIDGPLYTMKITGFDLQALVSGSTDLSDGSVNWDSVDLTRTPSDWLNSQDYNLFEINEKAGYWAFLAPATTNTITISNAALKSVTYTHRFNINGTNYNSVSGNIALTIDGLDTDTRAVPVVSATVAGAVVELANIVGSNIYTGKISSYEIANMTSGNNYEILANVADGLGTNLKSFPVGLNVDFTKPIAPIVDFGDGTTLAMTSSADATGYYIFNKQIPEENPTGASNLLAKLTAAEAASYGLCANTAKLAWDGEAYELNIVAVDGEGTFGKGNVSDTTVKTYVPMVKSAVRLIDTDNSETDATAIGTIYGSDCASQGTQIENYGVTLTSETDNQTVKMAYEPQNVTDTQATPIALFVNSTAGDSAVKAKISYSDVYAGKMIYIQLESRVYSLLLPTQAQIDGDEYDGADTGTSTDSPMDLNSATTGANEVKATYYTGQSL